MAFPPRTLGRTPKTGLAKAKVPRKPKPKAGLKVKPLRPRRATSLGQARRGGTLVLHTCGHKERHPFTGPKWKKARDIEWQKGQVCTACWSLGQAEAQEALCAVPDLPELDGAQRQITWARSLRAAAIARVQLEAWRMDQERQAKGLEPARDRYLALVLPRLLARTEAGWWIDQREGDPVALVLDFPTEDALEALRQEAAQVIPCPF